LAETDEDQEARDHKIVARWIKHFLQNIPLEVQSALDYAEKDSKGEIERLDPNSGGTPFMESDGDSLESVPETSN
jgi:hypothetical protein